jgi:hypothetical protein
LGNQLSGLWDGTEGRVGYHGITATSYIAMTVNGSTGIFTDNFGCPGGCRIDSAFGYFSNGSLGYYHDPNGAKHGVWFMYADLSGAPFVFTTSFESGYSYVVNNVPQPSCASPKNCRQEMSPFAATCGAWIIWRYLEAQFPLSKAIHQAFAYDNDWTAPSAPTLSINSGYYSCGDDGSGHCVGCGSSERPSGHPTVCLGRVCRDVPQEVPHYSIVLNSTGLSASTPTSKRKPAGSSTPPAGRA